MPTRITAAAVAVLALALAGCGSDDKPKPAPTVTVTKAPAAKSTAAVRKACVEAWLTQLEYDPDSKQEPAECAHVSGHTDAYLDAWEKFQRMNRG